MKVSHAITNFLNFQKINAQKKYGQELPAVSQQV